MWSGYLNSDHIMHKDAQLIQRHGGVTAFAKKLGLDAKGGAQRVSNWCRRGIPAQVKLDFPQFFQPKKKKAA